MAGITITIVAGITGKKGGIMKLAKISILLLLGMLFVITGCWEDVTGIEVKAEKRIPLVKGTPQTGKWKVFEYAMNYKYLYTQPKEDTLGSIELSGSLKKSPSRLDSLSIWIYLLDGNGRVLEKKRIYDSGYKKGRYMERSLTVKLTVPPETAGISFGHMARMSSGHR